MAQPEHRTIEVSGRVLEISNPNKVYFPGDGYTKRDLLRYYLGISPFLLPFLKDRPLVLRRYPAAKPGLEGVAVSLDVEPRG